MRFRRWGRCLHGHASRDGLVRKVRWVPEAQLSLTATSFRARFHETLLVLFARLSWQVRQAADVKDW